MHIFIDESGVFSTEPNPHAWSTVGGVVIPDASLGAVSTALEALKAAHGIGPGAEFKRDRPDCASVPYQIFLKSLDDAGCTLHVLPTRSTSAEGGGLELHKRETIAGIHNYASKVPDVTSHAEEVVVLVENLNHQEYNQCILQAQMICEMLPKVISHYANVSPGENGRFKWVIDRKNISENRYERAFKELYVGLISVRSRRQNSAIMGGEGHNYTPFRRAFSPDQNVRKLLQDSKELYGIDHTHLADSTIPVSFGALLQDKFSLEDSKHNFGI